MSHTDEMSEAEQHRVKFARRLPASLAELTGPTSGTVELPLHVVWSGLNTFDLANPRQRMGLYRTVLAEGMREDLCRHLNQDLLLSLWPTLRTLIGRSVRDVWEDAFPQLRRAAQAAA
ncbi:transcriptional regulator [Streptomyces triticagri]|uniref:Transcriptional regulator n=1 Tax=Streptomyces triticagri TaxID=2293568 RepID=A0A372M7H7_9ACTN|nr:transcriptional regulator [Streptomyces triticagri]RFU86894.1 transcriptional regulator [Streptomyces triticagri]